MLTKEITNRYQAVTRGIPRQRGWGSENREEQFSNRCLSFFFMHAKLEKGGNND